MSSISYSSSVETYISGGESFTCPGNKSLAVFLSLSGEKIEYIYIDLDKSTLYEFLI